MLFISHRRQAVDWPSSTLLRGLLSFSALYGADLPVPAVGFWLLRPKKRSTWVLLIIGILRSEIQVWTETQDPRG